MTPVQIANIITLANAARFIRQSIEKVGLEYIAPLDKGIQDEKICKALNHVAQSALIKEAE